MENQSNFLKAIQLPIDHPDYFPRLFSLLTKTRRSEDKNTESYKQIILEEYDKISRRLDRSEIQDSCSVRNVLRTRKLATFLINDSGEINSHLLPNLIKFLKANLYSLGPNRQYDAKRQEQILRVLMLLQESKELNKLLRSISKPHAHKYAEQIIRDTLRLPPNHIITDAHARRAALSAWMCYLRQNIGSCFATAPAIIIHDDQPELLLKDLNDLLNTGRLKRTFGGVEYSVPLSTSWGMGDLRKVFVFPKDLNQSTLELWQSPGFLLALESTNIIPEKMPIKEKIETAKNLIQDALNVWGGLGPFVEISMEKILEYIFLNHFSLTPKDLDEYQNRSRAMIHSALMMHVPRSSSGSGGKGEACVAYYQALETAVNAFKSLSDNALLKAWEFTIASFSESKANFARWNLYASLGLNPQEKGGIGEQIYGVIKHKLEESNEKVQEYQSQYEQLFTQVKYLEGRIRQASTEKEVEWIKVEYQSRVNEFYTIQDLRDQAHEKAKQFANMFDILIDHYDNKFPEYFQEVYDADMHDVDVGVFDDTPAGFRLLYKHGRSNTSQWTSIKNASEFTEALSSFFVATENEIASDPKLKGLESDISQFVTAIVSHLKTQEFIETCFYRMAAAYNMPIIEDPLHNLDKIEKKPWAYTSGGTMGTLVSTYFKREQKPTETSRWVENEVELMVFLTDTIKQIPHSISKQYQTNSNKSLLMHSPTHAFLLKPGFWPFKEMWQSEAFTYTWVRDTIIHPMKQFVEHIVLDEQMMHYLIEKIVKIIPDNYKHHFKNVFARMHGQKTVSDFRHFLLDTMAYDSGFRFVGGHVLHPDSIDSLLYSTLPLFPSYQLSERIENIFKQLPKMTAERLKNLKEITEDLISEHPPTSYLLDSKLLTDAALGILSLERLETSSPIDYPATIAFIMQKLGYAMPTPLIFADTNWSKDYFCFIVNPGTEKFELWKMDYTGRIGTPMSAWKQWVDGTRKDRQWGIYIKPQEYHS